MMSHLTEYNGKKFKSIAKGDLELGKLEDEQDQKQQKELSDEFKSLIQDLKDTLGERVKDVRVTVRLTNSPACIVSDQNDMTPQMERIMRAAGQAVTKTKPILEINPKHPVITNLQALKSKDNNKFI